LTVVDTGGADVTVAGSGTQTIAITDNDTATISIVDGATTVVAEGGPSQNVTATLTLNTSGSGPQILDVSITANLPGNLDYTAGAATFAAGSLNGATQNVVVTAIDDQIVEPTETFAGQALAITSSGQAIVNATGAETVQVTDNDSATVSITS